MRDRAGNLAAMPGVFPDYKAPVVRNAPDGVRELAMLRWGMPTSQLAQMEAAKKRAAKLEAKGKSVDFKELLRLEPDGGVTNIRNVSSKSDVAGQRPSIFARKLPTARPAPSRYRCMQFE